MEREGRGREGKGGDDDESRKIGRGGGRLGRFPLNTSSEKNGSSEFRATRKRGLRTDYDAFYDLLLCVLQNVLV